MSQAAERRYLVLVVGMLAGARTGIGCVYRLSKAQPSSFHFLVPATKPDYGLTWADEQAVADARQRLEIMIEFGSAMGMQVSGDVARTDDPVDAAREAADGFDEMMVIDNPHGLKRWRSERSSPGLRPTQGSVASTAERTRRTSRESSSTRRSFESTPNVSAPS